MAEYKQLGLHFIKERAVGLNLGKPEIDEVLQKLKGDLFVGLIGKILSYNPKPLFLIFNAIDNVMLFPVYDNNSQHILVGMRLLIVPRDIFYGGSSHDFTSAEDLGHEEYRIYFSHEVETLNLENLPIIQVTNEMRNNGKTGDHY